MFGIRNYNFAARRLKETAYQRGDLRGETTELILSDCKANRISINSAFIIARGEGDREHYSVFTSCFGTAFKCT